MDMLPTLNNLKEKRKLLKGMFMQYASENQKLQVTFFGHVNQQWMYGIKGVDNYKIFFSQPIPFWKSGLY